MNQLAACRLAGSRGKGVLWRDYAEAVPAEGEESERAASDLRTEGPPHLHLGPVGSIKATLLVTWTDRRTHLTGKQADVDLARHGT